MPGTSRGCDLSRAETATDTTVRRISDPRCRAVLVLIVVFLAWQSPNFLTATNLTVVSRQIALALFLSIGMTFVILSGAIDLSVGSVVALVSVTVGQLMVTAGLPPVLATIGALVVGALVGVFNGAVVAYTRIPSFVVTLWMLAMASGLALGITQGQTISGFPQGFLAIGQGSTLGLPNPVWLASWPLSSRTWSWPAQRSAVTSTCWAATSGPRCSRVSRCAARRSSSSRSRPLSRRARRSSRRPG
jgi:ABC-type xylose transport system permease subunit